MKPPRVQTIITPADHDYLTLAKIDDDTTAVIWSRAGELRLISSEMLDEARRLYTDGNNMCAAGRTPELPREWSAIAWGSCKPVTTPHHVTVHQ